MRWPVSLLFCLQLSASTHAALFVDPDGRGQVLLFPYFTVNSSNDSLLVISNHSDDAKALKLRFREGQNGRALASFNLYLAPRDSWTAGLFSLSDAAPAAVTTVDNSCTVPTLKTSTELPRLPSGQPYQSFSSADYSGTRDDAGPDDLARTREGWFEVIEMGTLRAGTAAYSASLTPTTGIDPYIRNGVPDCPWFQQAWSGGAFSMDAAAQLDPPSGGLSGRLYIVDVPDGTALSLRATALGGFSRQVQHGAPDSALPDLSSARTESADTGIVTSQAWTGHGLLRSTWPASAAIDAVSAILMRSEISAEVTTETGLAASTEWILSMPTRPWYTDQARVGPMARPPFTVLFPAAGVALPQGPDCERFEARFHDREGVVRSTRDFIFNLPDVPSASCSAAQVITFSQGGAVSRILGSRNRQNLSASANGFVTGQVQLTFTALAQRRLVSREGHAYAGLPLIGHAIETIENRNARPGTIGFYAESSPVTGSLRCRMADAAGGEQDCVRTD